MSGEELDKANDLLFEAFMARIFGRTAEAVEYEDRASQSDGFSPSLYGQHLLSVARRIAIRQGREHETAPLLELAWRNLQGSKEDLTTYHLGCARVRQELGDTVGAYQSLRAADDLRRN